MRGRRAAAAGRCSAPLLSIAGLGRDLLLPRRGAAVRHGLDGASGSLLYVVYRSREGLSLTRHGRGARASACRTSPRSSTGSILVPGLRRGARRRHHEHGGPARQRAARRRRGGREDRGDLRASRSRCRCRSTPSCRRSGSSAREAALARAKQVGEEYEGVEVTRHAGARPHGRARRSSRQARRTTCEAIVIGAEPPSQVKGGGVLGGIAGGRPQRARGGDGLRAGEGAHAGCSSPRRPDAASGRGPHDGRRRDLEPCGAR